MGIERVGIAMLAFKYMNKDNNIELVPVNDSYSVVRHTFEVMEDFPDTTRVSNPMPPTYLDEMMNFST